MNGTRKPCAVCASLVLAVLLASSITAAAAEETAEPRATMAIPKATSATYTFPQTAVGQTATQCGTFCFDAGTSTDCNASGTAFLIKDVSSPFRSHDYHLIPAGGDCHASGTPVSFPVAISSGQQLAFFIDFSPVKDGTFMDSLELGPSQSNLAILNLIGSTPSAGSRCVPNATTLCIDHNPGDSRFQIQVSYSTAQGGGLAGAGNAISLSSIGVAEGGLFWFFGAGNPEMLIKIIDGCSLGGHFWIFFSATTNVGFTVTVTDTATSAQAIYHNHDMSAALPLQDTSALSCP